MFITIKCNFTLKYTFNSILLSDIVKHCKTNLMDSHTKANIQDNLMDLNLPLTKRITVRISEPMHQLIEKISKKLRRKEAETIRLAIEEFINQQTDP